MKPAAGATNPPALPDREVVGGRDYDRRILINVADGYHLWSKRYDRSRIWRSPLK